MAETPSAGGGNLFTRKIGPLPMWGWVSVVGGAIVVWAMYARKKAGSQQNQTPSSGASLGQQPPVIYQGYTTNNVNVPPGTEPPPNASPDGSAQTRPPVQPAPSMRPASPAQNAPLTVSYVPGGFPGGPAAATAAGAPAQTTGAAYNFSAAQIQQMGFPNLRGLTLAQVQKALAAYQGGAYHIQNESGNTAGRVVSFTPYSTGQVNLGFA